MKRLMFISSELPFPAHSGGKLKSLNMIKHFSKHFEVTLVCPLKLEDAEHLNQFWREVPLTSRVCSEVNRERSLKNWLASCIKGVPLNVYRTESAALRKKVAEIAHRYDVIFVDHFEAAQYVPKDYRGRVIYHAHKAYHQVWQQFAAKEIFVPRRLAASFEARRVESSEVNVCKRADIVFAAPNDIESLSAASTVNCNFQRTYHLGDQHGLWARALQYRDTELALVYVGYLGWEPNADGLLWFIDRVWPTVKSLVPELKLNIVGKNADKRILKAVAGDPNINLLGYVENLDDILSTSRINIAPIKFGSGMNIKVMDALARGLPTVTTRRGIEGVEAIDGVHVALAETPDEMSRAIIRLLKDRIFWQRLSRESRTLMHDKYSWKAVLDDQVIAISALMLEGRVPRTEFVDATCRWPAIRQSR